MLKRTRLKGTRTMPLLKLLVPAFSLTLFLTGCSDLVEVQDRDFVLALGAALNGDKYEFTFALPDLSLLTQEGGEDESNNGQTRTYESVFLAEIEDLYNHGSNKRLDYRHLDALIIDEALSSSAEKLPALFEYIENNYQISRNVRVFYYSGDVKELLETKGQIGGGIGNYLDKLENINQRKNDLPSVTIGNLMDSFSQHKGIVVPLLELKEDKLEINGAAIFQDSVFVKTLSEEELNIYYVIRGQGKDLNFRIGDNLLFKLKDYSSKTQYLYEGGKPLIVLAIEGTAESLSIPDTVTSADVNGYLTGAIIDQLGTCFKDDGIDYINLYHDSGLKNRSMWLDYQGRQTDFIGDLIFDVQTDIAVP